MKKKQKISVFERKTKGLKIRPYKRTDFQVWREFVGESAAANAFALIINLQTVLNSSSNICHLGVFERESGALIGMVIFHSIERKDQPRGEVALWIPKAKDRKKYEKELAKASLEIGFDSLGLGEIIITSRDSKRLSRLKVKKKITSFHEGT
jgi:RimJ/RimL family protein N-acetyltransferase